MKNKDKSSIKRESKYLNYEFKMFKNFSKRLCCSADKIVDSFEHFSEMQKSEIIQELERTNQNLHAVGEYVNYLSGVKVDSNRFVYVQAGERVTVVAVTNSIPHKHKD